MNIKDSDLIALAGLLHDIGKFRQRTGKDVENFDLNFSVCDSDGRCYYLHAAHTSRALEEMGFADLKNLIYLAASHHKSNLSGHEEIIKRADIYASGERQEGEGGNFKRSKLISIFSEVGLKHEPEKYYFELQKFTEDIAMSNSNKEYKDEKEAEKRYSDLYEEFLRDIKELKLKFTDNSTQDFLNLVSVLEKYTTFIPASSYKPYPDISLFDHMLVTAAIATAMLQDKEKFYLIQGDFTGIQDFIFAKEGKSNKYLAKIFRARSLFVSLAVDFIALKICSMLNITPLSIIINAGGKFTILAPKVDDIEKILNEVRSEVNEEFKKINYLQTKFVIDYIEERFSNLAYGKASEVFKKLAVKFEQAKLKVDVGIDVFCDYINSFREGYERCDICGVVPAKIPSKEGEICICSYCKKFKEWGEKISKFNYIEFDLQKGILDGIDIVEEKKEVGKVYFSVNENENFAFKRVANYLPEFTEKDKDDSRYQLVEWMEEEDFKGVKSFDCIAVSGLEARSDGFYGRKYLAILKADVDNLGSIFVNGFKRRIVNGKELAIIGEGRAENGELVDKSTISRIVSLSRLMDFYFTTLLKKMIRERYKNIYTVFAGGDDLFLIGHYKDIMNIQKDIVSTFKEFTKNDDLHLSFGITLTNYNAPITQMAYKAEEDLHKAKTHGNKNNSTIFDIVVRNEELDELLDKKEEFSKLLNDLSMGIMYKLYEFINMKQKLTSDASNETILINARWKALLRYTLAKKLLKEKGQDYTNALAGKLIEDIEKFGEKLIIPLNLVLYEQRKYSKKGVSS